MDALSADDLALLDTETSIDTLSDYAPDCYPMFTPAQARTLLLCTVLPAPIPAPSTLLSPRMTAVFASTNNSGSSYFGSLTKFLNFQAEFYRTFPNPIPLFITPAPSELFVPLSIDSTSASTVIHAFINQCKFQVFLPIYTAPIVSVLLTVMAPLPFTPQYKH